jgi:hypothetical protein
VITYDVFINDPPPQDNGFLPNGEPKLFSPQASAGTIAQMDASVAARPLLWDKVYTGIPPTPVTAVTVPDNRFTLEGHERRLRDVAGRDRQGRGAQAAAHRRRAPEQGARRRRRPDDRGDAAVPRRRRGAPAHRGVDRRLLQREGRPVPEPSRPDGAVGGGAGDLRRARAPGAGHGPDPSSPPGSDVPAKRRGRSPVGRLAVLCGLSTAPRRRITIRERRSRR